ncbi:hypothetical protein ACFE33_07320 [Falsihalocynthiibacter sp. SS001]|uniref:hypothetical protein n=1 Tax=Falsihalocynthiibacter sp. SS001 TaxID=3349698 RepID=UPI0036D2815A
MIYHLVSHAAATAIRPHIFGAPLRDIPPFIGPRDELPLRRSPDGRLPEWQEDGIIDLVNRDGIFCQ